MLSTGSGIDTATWALVGVTAALVIVTFIMAIANWRSASKSAEAAQAAVRAAEAAEQDLRQGRELIEIGQQQAAAIQEQAKAAAALARLSRESLEASFRPLLVPVIDRPTIWRWVEGLDHQLSQAQVLLGPQPLCWVERDEHFWAVLPLRNVGPGPALFSPQPSDVLLSPHNSAAGYVPGRPSSMIVASGDVIDVVFDAPANEFLRAMAGPPVASPSVAVATAEIRYTDAGGRRITATKVRLGRGPEISLVVTSVEVLAPQGDPDLIL